MMARNITSIWFSEVCARVGRRSAKGEAMAFHATIRGVLFLVFATFFFLALYTLTGIPEAQVKLTESNATVDLREIVSSLYEQNYSCHLYYRHRGRKWPPSSSSCPLGDLGEFRYLINRDICGTDDVYMVILVGSHPSHTTLRHVIRSTWGNPQIPGFPFKIAFTFGHIESAEQQFLIEEESLAYRDIIQGNFRDSYRNVTLRDLMGLRWVWQHCSQAKYVMRADDDVSVDIYGLVDVLEENFGHAPDFVGCFQMMVDTPVLRTGRYEVTKEEHPSDTYDPYCQGWMYMLTPHMAYALDLAALKVKPYWMNDAYLTGTLVKALGKVPHDLRVNYTINIYDMQLAESVDAKLPPRFTVGPTGGDENLTFILHQNYKYYAKLHGLPKHRWTKKPSRLPSGPMRQRHVARDNEIRREALSPLRQA